MKEAKMLVRHSEEIAWPRERVASPDRLALSPVLNGDNDVVEFPLLITAQQARALEAAAHRGRLTVGQLARHIIRAFLSRE